MSTSFTDNADERRYELHSDGELAGFVEYRLRPDSIALLHTEVGSEFGGRGFGSQLAGHVLDDARQRNLAVLPYCPFLKDWIAKHPDYVDLVPEARRATFGL